MGSFNPDYCSNCNVSDVCELYLNQFCTVQTGDKVNVIHV